ncbi:Protein of unknown function (DUF974) [Nesidiocoris tenuis]|uniref:Trafficking protein particle complex subunit 13 n=1 Tax=Nesidiocoris tenuis TaxID=355587 RepID=A0ABN7B401_9HEMI|nr:Protein of unknown function (DUF974) [Nesidiocoris tenuis]
MDPPTKPDHLVSLKVMRLTRPSLVSPVVVTNDAKDLAGNLFNTALKRDVAAVPGTETINASCFLLLPQCFGSIYLGETFSCYICVNNTSDQLVKDVTFRASLQVPNKTIHFPTETQNSADLPPGGSVDEVIHHEVKEIGHHILVCEVGYCSGALTGERLGFRKYFQFEVHQPLDVKTKLYTVESNDVFFEAKVQNTTSGNLILERVSLESSPYFSVEKYNTLQKVGDLQLNVMAPGEKKQFLYCLRPDWKQVPNLKSLFDTTYIGKLDIVWRSSLGERGRLQTSQLHKKPQEPCDLHLSVVQMPGVVFVRQMFTATFKLSNLTDRMMDIRLHLAQAKGFAWIGPSGVFLGQVAPSGSTTFNLNMVPLATGLLNIQGIRVEDPLQSKVYDYDDIILQVFAVENDQAKKEGRCLAVDTIVEGKDGVRPAQTV